MEIVKRKFLKIGSNYGVSVCVDAETVCGDDAEDAMFMYHGILKRGGFNKCIFCRYQHKPTCEKLACKKAERKDGKSVFFERG